MIYRKLKAAGLHFSLSLIVITLAIGLIIYFWYPNSLLKVSNFKEIALLLIVVDLVLGPLLTLVIYKPNKKSLKFDLGTIAVVQTAALAYGLFTIYLAHPVYITFNVDRFTIISAKDAKPQQAKLNDFKISTLSAPKLAVAKLPNNEKEKSDLLKEVVMEGKPDIKLRPELYQPFEENIDDILAKSLDPDIIFKSSEAEQKLKKFLEEYGSTKNDYAFLPIEGSAKDAIWVLEKKTADPIDIILTNPWTTAAKK